MVDDIFNSSCNISQWNFQCCLTKVLCWLVKSILNELLKESDTYAEVGFGGEGVRGLSGCKLYVKCT